MKSFVNVWYLTFLLILLGIGLFGAMILVEGPNNFVVKGYAFTMANAAIGMGYLIIAIVSVAYFFSTRKHWNTDDDISYKANYLEREGFGVSTFVIIVIIVAVTLAIWFITHMIHG